MSVTDLVGDMAHHADVRKVFGDPVERDGVTLVPVASVRAGAGGGRGEGPPRGMGGGYGITARPLGVYVIRDGEVRFQPALDLARIIAGGQIVALVALLVLRSVITRRRR